MEQKLIAITGGTGQIGSSLVRQLIREGVHVRVLIRKPAGRQMLPEDVECFRGCLPHQVPDEFMMGCTTVVHLAAVVPRTRPIAPNEMDNVNTKSLSTLLTLARQYHVQRLIYISTARVLNLSENAYLSPYLCSKKAAEACLNQSNLSPKCLIVYLPTVLTPPTEVGSSLSKWLLHAARRRWVMGPAKSLPFHLIDLNDVVKCICTFIHNESLFGAWVLSGHCVHPTVGHHHRTTDRTSNSIHPGSHTLDTSNSHAHQSLGPPKSAVTLLADVGKTPFPEYGMALNGRCGCGHMAL